jgi:hypothetical protein
MRSSGSSRWKKVRAEQGKGTEVNEDQSLWKTTDVKDEEFWFLKVEEGKSWGGKDWDEWRSELLEDHWCEGWGVLVPQGWRR